MNANEILKTMEEMEKKRHRLISFINICTFYINMDYGAVFVSTHKLHWKSKKWNLHAFMKEYRPVNSSAAVEFLLVKNDNAMARYNEIRRRGKFGPQYRPPNGEFIKSAGSDDCTSE